MKMNNLNTLFSVLPHMQYEEHNSLVSYELYQYYNNVKHNRIPANDYEIAYATNLIDYTIKALAGRISIEEARQKISELSPEYEAHADFERMRNYLTPITLCFLYFPDYDEELRGEFDKFFNERYPEHATQTLQKEANA